MSSRSQGPPQSVALLETHCLTRAEKADYDSRRTYRIRRDRLRAEMEEPPRRRRQIEPQPPQDQDSGNEMELPDDRMTPPLSPVARRRLERGGGGGGMNAGMNPLPFIPFMLCFLMLLPNCQAQLKELTTVNTTVTWRRDFRPVISGFESLFLEAKLESRCDKLRLQSRDNSSQTKK